MRIEGSNIPNRGQRAVDFMKEKVQILKRCHEQNDVVVKAIDSHDHHGAVDGEDDIIPGGGEESIGHRPMVLDLWTQCH